VHLVGFITKKFPTTPLFRNMLT